MRRVGQGQPAGEAALMSTGQLARIEHNSSQCLGRRAPLRAGRRRWGRSSSHCDRRAHKAALGREAPHVGRCRATWRGGLASAHAPHPAARAGPRESCGAPAGSPDHTSCRTAAGSQPGWRTAGRARSSSARTGASARAHPWPADRRPKDHPANLKLLTERGKRVSRSPAAGIELSRSHTNFSGNTPSRLDSGPAPTRCRAPP